jgi:hypothetical protein
MPNINIDDIEQPKIPISLAELEILSSIVQGRYGVDEWTYGLADGSGKANTAVGGYLVSGGYNYGSIIVNGGSVNGRPVGILEDKDGIFMAAFDPATAKKLIASFRALFDFYSEVCHRNQQAIQRERIGAPEPETSQEDVEPF